MAEGGSLGFSEVRAAVAAKGVSNAECVQVVVRCRPMNSKEKEENRMHIVDIDTNLNQVSLKACEGGVARSFTFDGAFDEKTQQRPFYDDACFPLVESILEGFNATIFAYGQTGCGKSFSMQGPASPPAPPEMRGVIPNAFAHLFEFVKSTRDIEFLVRCSYLELYNEVVRDLLDTKTDKTCDIRQDPKKGIFVNNLSEVVVDTAEKIQAVLDRGLSGRTVAATAMNAESSRSHSIFTIIIEMSSKDPDTGRDILRAGKLNLVDLAGSERQKKTGAAGDILKQGAMINQSLTTLGNVIQSLAEAREHVPYRDSKLTRLLQDSLGGNTKTLMIAALSPADYNYDETLSTLRYANRAKNIKNKPKINEDPKDTLLRTYKDEIARLKKQLEEYMSGGGAPPGESEGGEGSSGTNAGNNLDMGALNNMMKMLSGESMSTEAITSHSSAKLTHDNASNFDPEALEGIDETENMDFAAFATAAPEAENSNSNLTPKSPRGEQPADVSPRSTKKRSPAKSATGKDDDDHEMLLAEHEYAHSLVKEKDHEIRLERQKAQEMTEKLRQLEAQLMGNMHAAFTPFGAADMAPGVEGDSISNAKMLPKETEFEIQERERARLEYEKRKQAIKNKREKKRARERNEKEEAQREREYLWDNLKEQSRALEDEIQEKKLYKSICEAVLSQKELRRILDKCQWDDEINGWHLPATKQRNANDAFILPDINGCGGNAGMMSGFGSTANSARRPDEEISMENGYGNWGAGNTMQLTGSKNSSRGNNSSRAYSPRETQSGSNMSIQLPPPTKLSNGLALPLESQTPRSRVNSRQRKEQAAQSLPGVSSNGNPLKQLDGVAGMESAFSNTGILPHQPNGSKPPKGKKKKRKNKNKEEGYTEWGFVDGVEKDGKEEEPAYSDDEHFDDDGDGNNVNGFAFSELGHESNQIINDQPTKKIRKVKEKDSEVSPRGNATLAQNGSLFPKL